MNDRTSLARELTEMEQTLKELVICYEQYFAGVEKREPVKHREALAGKLRRITNHRIHQTDLRFRYQNLASRFQTYSQHWDRILRLMDEGKYHRQVRPAPPSASPAAGEGSSPPAGSGSEVDTLYRHLQAAHQACRTEGSAPDRQQFEKFLEKQKEKIREKFGERAVEFVVVTEDGKPKIKVRARK